MQLCSCVAEKQPGLNKKEQPVKMKARIRNDQGWLCSCVVEKQPGQEGSSNSGVIWACWLLLCGVELLFHPCVDFGAAVGYFSGCAHSQSVLQISYRDLTQSVLQISYRPRCFNHSCIDDGAVHGILPLFRRLSMTPE